MSGLNSVARDANEAVLLTPAGAAAIAVVRLRGPLVGDFLRAHFSRPAVAGRCVHGELVDSAGGGGVLDDPVVVVSEDLRTADLSLHGGPWIVRRTLELAGRAGFAVLAPPPLPLPEAAVDGETALAREVLAWLPLARTELALRVLLAQEQNWAEFLRRWRERLRHPAADDDREQWRQAVRGILENRSLSRLLDPPRVAIVGAANVGKSTLANQLFAQERSITADLPGTTRDWVGEIANVDGLAVLLLDTPGLRDTEDAIERAAIDRSRAPIAAADLVVLVLDAARPLEPEQAPLLAAFPGALRVVNKADRAAEWDAVAVLPALATVATSGQGIDALRRAIASHLGCADVDPAQPRCWTPRQRQVLEQAMDEAAELGEGLVLTVGGAQ